VVDPGNAVLPNSANQALDATHAKLCKFSGAENGELQRVLGSFRRLIDRAASTTRAPRERREELGHSSSGSLESGLKVLSLDGGGVKGLFSIIVLEHLMEGVRQIDAPHATDPLKPCDYFDLIGGTSTGGLLAVMLGRLRMDVRDCEQAYRELSSKIFKKTIWTFPGKMSLDALWGKPWYSGENLEAAIKTILSRRISISEEARLEAHGVRKEDAPLKAPEGAGSRCFVCALAEGQRQTERLRSYEAVAGVGGPDCSI